MMTAASEHRSPERVDFLAGVVVTAIEGGLNWAERKTYRWAEADDGSGRLVRASAMVREDNEDGTYGPWHDLTTDTIAKGVRLALAPGFQVNGDIRAAIADGNRGNDAGEVDAEAADVIVQAALFGAIVYD